MTIPGNNVKVDGFDILVHPYKEYISEEIRTKGGYEQEYIKIITSFIKPGDSVLDVGANIGIHTLHYSVAVGKQGKVLAFEPDPTNLELLRHNVKRNKCNNVSIYPLALSNASYVGKLYLCERNKGKQSFADLDNLNDPINVKVCKISDIPEALKANVVKMDVEGAEPMVFEGFDNFRPPIIFFEFTTKQLFALNNDPLTFLNLLIAEGYKLFMTKGTKLIPIKAKYIAELAAQTNKDYSLLAKL